MKLFTKIKNIYISIYKLGLNSVYKVACLLRKTDENKMVIALYRTNYLDDNLKLVYKEVQKQAPHIKIHLIQGTNKMNLKLFIEILVFSNARYLIIDDYFLPIYLITPHKKLKVIQLWHAAGAFKKFGHSTIGSRFGPQASYLKLVPVHANYNFVYISARKFTKYYAEAFNMDSRRIFNLGLPRLDMITNEELHLKIISKMYKKYSFLKDKGMINILMAPTYRAKGSQGETGIDLVDTILQIAKRMDINKRIILKPHPYMSVSSLEKIRNCRNVFIADSSGINEWMLVVDAFITDYSSAIFEFSLLKKPMAHFVPDYDEYVNSRGFYTCIEENSDATVLKDITELANWINSRQKDESFDSSRMIAFNFDYIEDATTRIVSHFLSNEK